MAKKILIIDDEDLITRSLMKLLKVSGYEPTIAHSGKEALKHIQKSDFDLVISDVRMPEMDGIEVIKQIRACRSGMNKTPIPEVMITGYADIEKHEAAMDLEVSNYLSKPFDNEEFLQIVRRVIG